MKFLILLLLFFSCGLQDPSREDDQKAVHTQQKLISNFFSEPELKVNVFYEIGAEPRDSNFPLNRYTTWDITLQSLQALFSNRTTEITVPKKLNEMTSFADQAKSQWTSSELIDLGNKYHTSGLSIIFVNGKLKDNVVGVHYTGYPFAFVFKDLIERVGKTTREQIYAEQATVVHELGHALGVVNNGVSLTSDHEDTDHPKHTKNEECVMYWAVESDVSLGDMIRKFNSGDKLNLFGSEVLQDAHNF